VLRKLKVNSELTKKCTQWFGERERLNKYKSKNGNFLSPSTIWKQNYW
jgi:hypothetical protein